MSPEAMALALVLHGLMVLAIWWMATSRPQPPATEEPVTVTFEAPKPQPKPEPPPKPPEQPKVQTQPQPVEGLRPEAAITADKRSQVPPPPKPDDFKQGFAPPQAVPESPDAKRSPTAEAPEPPIEPPKPALPEPAPQPAPSPALPPPKPTEQATILPAPAPARPSPPVQQPLARPSPLTSPPQRRPPQVAHAEEPPSSSPFVNPADVYNRARVSDNYLWQVVRKLQGYRYQAKNAVNEAVTVVRITIARDGRLLDAEISRSSGFPEMDRGVLAGVRAGSPYTPLPPDIQGSSATFTLPLVSVFRE
jgi:protein TonB